MDNVDQTKVAHTAVFASMSKASASQATSSASKKLKQQTPLIDRIYSLRRDVVHHLVSSCTSILSDQLIILGAGLDSSYNSLAKEVFHVDFESVISDYDISQAGPNVHLVAADLRNTVDLEVQLLKNGLRANARTVVLIECVLCYLTVDDVRMLLSWIGKTLSRSLLIIYDPLVPESAVGAASFTRQMQRGFASRGTPLLSPTSCPWKHNLQLRECGLRHAYTATMDQLRSICTPPTAPTLAAWRAGTDADGASARVFDEHCGELMLNQHYVASVSSNHTDSFRQVVSGLPAQPTALYPAVAATHTPSEAQLHRAEVLAARIKALEMLVYSRGVVVDGNTGAGVGECSGLTAEQPLSSGLVQVAPASTARATAHRVADLYQTCFDPFMKRYACVHKFASKTVKELRQGRWGPGLGSSVWVATVSGARSLQGGKEIDAAADEIVGCIALKLKTDRRREPAAVGMEAAGGGNYMISDKKPESGETAVSDGAESDPAPATRVVVGELSCMCVSPRYRGCGIARALLTKALAHARAALSGPTTAVRVDLSTIIDQERARGCYEAAGFTCEREEELPDGCRLVYMSLALISAGGV